MICAKNTKRKLRFRSVIGLPHLQTINYLPVNFQKLLTVVVVIRKTHRKIFQALTVTGENFYFQFIGENPCLLISCIKLIAGGLSHVKVGKYTYHYRCRDDAFRDRLFLVRTRSEQEQNR